MSEVNVAGDPGWIGRIHRWAESRPDLALMSPFLLYLALLSLKDIWPEYNWLASLVRGTLPLALVWVLRSKLGPWGKPHWGLALLMGAITAAGWYYGQFLFNQLGVPHRVPLPPLFTGQPTWSDPTATLGTGGLFWLTAVTHILVACTTVGFVEELFWRSFLLRAMIDWDDFERLPLGKFAWRSFIGTSLLSVLQHPDNWAVSILCWMLFNLLMYWKRSVLFLALTHNFTNLLLYAWVLYAGLAMQDDRAWMHLTLVAGVEAQP